MNILWLNCIIINYYTLNIKEFIMKKIILAVVLLLAASSNAEVMYGPGVHLLHSNEITSADGLVSVDSLQRSESSCGCGLFSCGCGC
jgi:hypothetical protein